MVPGDTVHSYGHEDETRQVLEDAEKELSTWERDFEPIQTGAGELSSNLLGTPRNNFQQDGGNGAVLEHEPADSERTETIREQPQSAATEGDGAGEGPSRVAEAAPPVATVDETEVRNV